MNLKPLTCFVPLHLFEKNVTQSRQERICTFSGEMPRKAAKNAFAPFREKCHAKPPRTHLHLFGRNVTQSRQERKGFSQIN
jgi:hypothetical protein